MLQVNTISCYNVGRPVVISLEQFKEHAGNGCKSEDKNISSGRVSVTESWKQCQPEK